MFYKCLGGLSLRIVLLGAPGVGKGTQAKLISENFNMPHISTGDIFRSNIKENTDLGIKAKTFIVKGELVPDDITVAVVKERLAKKDCENGFLLDGFPRNLYQAENLNVMLSENSKAVDRVFLIDLTRETILERIAGRRFCIKCGSSYHLKYNPTKVTGVCDSCGEALIQRYDDKEEVVSDRLTIYNRTIEPLVNYYSHLGILFKVQGSGSINDIFNRIAEGIKVI
jgi:adenylate kinase